LRSVTCNISSTSQIEFVDNTMGSYDVSGFLGPILSIKHGIVNKGFSYGTYGSPPPFQCPSPSQSSSWSSSSSDHAHRADLGRGAYDSYRTRTKVGRGFSGDYTR
jgi:hypothetical protein